MLTKLTGIPVRVTVASDYAAVIEALRNRTADLAFVHPGGYVLASREAKATIVAQATSGTARARSPRASTCARSPASRRSRTCAGKTMAFIDPGQLLRLHLSDGAPDPARPREEPRSEDLLPRGRLRRRARRRHARAAQRPRGRARLVRHGPRAVPERSRPSASASSTSRRPGDPRGGHRGAGRARSGRPSRRCATRSCRSARPAYADLLKRLYEIDGFAPAEDRDYDPVRAAIELLGVRPR